MSSRKKLKVSTKPECPMSVRSKIKKFRRDFVLALDEIREKMEDDFDHFSVSWDEVCRKLRNKWGLQRMNHDGVSSFLFISKRHGFVVKRSYLCANDFERPPTAIFTESIPFKNDSDDDGDGPVYVQPIAKVDWDSREAAYEAITESDFDPADCHEGNVAIYRGKAVSIDW